MPAAHITKRLAEWLAIEGPTFDSGELGPIECLAERMEVDRSWLEKLSRGEYEWISFDKADRLMCAMNYVHEWLHHPEYQGFNLKRLDKIRPITTRRHGGGRVAKWNTALAIQLFKAGTPYEEIAEKVGVDVKTVREMMSLRGLTEKNQLGFRARARTYDYAEAMRLHEEEGLNWVEVADRMGVKANSLRAAMNRVKRGEQELGKEAA